MNNKLVVIRGKVQLVGDMVERRIARFQLKLSRRVQTLMQDLARTLLMSRAAAWLATQFMAFGLTGTQAGFSAIGVLVGAAVVIFGLVLFATRGLPVIYTMTSNTTAMTTAGMSTDAIQWTTWGVWGVILFIIAAVVVMVVRNYKISGGGGGGGGGRRRRR